MNRTNKITNENNKIKAERDRLRYDNLDIAYIDYMSSQDNTILDEKYNIMNLEKVMDHEQMLFMRYVHNIYKNKGDILEFKSRVLIHDFYMIMCSKK
jgi:hypothetical protein